MLYRSTDSGVTWTAMAAAGTRNWRRVCISADGTKIAAGTYGEYVHLSSDSGATWTPATSLGTGVWYDIACSSDGTKLVTGKTGGQIYTSADSGATWAARDSNRSWLGVVSSADGSRLAATVTGGQIYTSVGDLQPPNVTAMEDSGPQTNAAFATSISVGPANESAQTVSFLVTNDNNALFSSQPALAANGTLTFTPAANTFGLANVGVIAVDSGGAPGVSNSAAQTFTIAITNVNDAPAITFATNNLVVLEDAGAQSLGGFLSLAPGPFAEPGTVTLISVANDNNTLFSSQPAFSGGTLDFTPAADANGSATVTVIAEDDTGLFSTNSFTLTVLPVNDAPSLSLTNLSITVVTNSAYSASLGANVVLGPANESGQTPATFVITNDNNALFSVQPSANAAGTLSFTAAPGQLGTATLHVRVQDAGGTANGGVNLSAPVLVTVTVTPGNSVPTFTLATNALAVLEDSGAFSGGGFLTALSPGSQGFEAGQVVTVTTANNNSNLFSAQPAISGGTLTFTPAANAFGSATVTVTATDNGTPNLSSSQTVTITVTPVNDAPGFTLNGGLTGWTTKAPMLGGGVNAAAGGVINGVWYIAGGGPPGGSTTNGLQAYDPVANTWTTRTPAGVSRGAAAAGVIANKLYVAGGAISLDYNTPTLALEIYDPVTDSWTGGAALSVPRAGAASAVIGDKLYVAGGQGSFPYHAVTALEIYDPISNSWTAGAPLPTAVGNAVGAAINGKFYVAGGTTGPANVALLQIYDPVSNTWTSGTPLSGPRGYASGGVIDGKLVVVGGVDASSTLIPTVEIYDPVTDAWTTGTPEPLPRSFAVAAVINAKLHVAGGSSTDTLEVYTPAVTVAEDSGAQAVAAFATGISVGPANESAQSLTFITSNTASNLFSSQPVLTFGGTLTFTPAANANGSATVSVYAQDNGGTANGGVNTTAVQAFTIVITPVNDAPSATFATNNVVVLEDSGPAGFAGFATFFLPADEAGQSITNVVATNSNNALFSVQPGIGLDGSLTFTPAPNAFGSAVVSVIAQDNGGTANGGQNTSAAATFTITVTGVNDAPSFTVLSNLVAVLEDSGAQTVPNAVTGISAGPGESQSVGFVTSNTASNLFTGSGQPVIGANGTLTFTPAPNANGSATVLITATDSGGTANGGVNTSAPQALVITIVNINDPPIVTFATNHLVRLEDSGPYSGSGFATFSAPADELAQSLLGYTVANSSNALFSVQPSLALDGTLTFTPATNFSGSVVVTVFAQDDGGTANGGVDTAAPQNFTITVTPVNDAPTFTKGADQVVFNGDGAQTVTNWATAISHGPADEAAQLLNFTISNDNNGIFAVQPALSTNGTLTWTPLAGTSGIATVTLQLTDDGGTADGGTNGSVAQTFTITVASTKVFVGTVPDVSPEGAVTASISLAGLGAENSVSFTLDFNPAHLAITSVSLGGGAAGATLITNNSQLASGKLGVVVLRPANTTFPAGTNELLLLGVRALGTAVPGNAPLTFSSTPVRREVTDTNADVLAFVAYVAGHVPVVTPGAAVEGDVSPRPNGNGIVSVTDAVLVGRFVAGLDTAAAGGEFQRADSAPRATAGDGQITLADLVQSLRFAAGLDTPGAPGGPTTATAALRTAALLPAGARTVRVVSGSLAAGQVNTVTVQLDAQGNEAGLSLSLAFDPTALTFVGASTGSGATGAFLQTNPDKAAAGKVGLVLVMPAGSTLAAGTRDVVTLTFNVTGSGATAISVTGDSPVAREVADVNANVLNANYVGGTFNIILPAGLKAAGMERAADGSLRLVVRNADGTPITAAQAARYEVQVTSNLGGAWTVLPNALVVENGALKIVDPAANAAGLRLYKLVETP